MCERKSDVFANEIELIQSEDLRDFVKFYLDTYPPVYFWEIGASSSGKYHPAMSQGKGGLVRHTKAVCLFLEEILRMSTYAYMKDEYKDFARIACICHDTIKYGKSAEINKDEYKFHARFAAIAVDLAWNEFFGQPAPFLLTNAIASHMGQWSTERDDRPFTQIDRAVHLADYMASRPFIDIPSLCEDKGE